MDTNISLPNRRQIIPRGFEKYRQFVNWRIIDGEKVPCDRGGVVINAHDPKNWLSADEAMQSRFGVAFVFTRDDVFFFIDLDGHWNGSEWSDTAKRILAMFPGAAVEVSQSRTGLHIFGSGSHSIPADHKCRNQALGIEIYTHGRFVALTGHQAAGSAEIDFSPMLPGFLTEYGLERAVTAVTPLRRYDGPAAGYTGPADDGELIDIMLSARGSTAAQFRDKPHVRDLWSGNIEVLAAAYPAGRMRPDGLPFDHSAADQALMFHLAFYTGKDAARMERLFRMSALYRPGHYDGKRVHLMDRMIDGATAGCKRVYDRPVNLNDQLMQPAAPALPAPRRDFNELHTNHDLDALDLPEPDFLVKDLIAAGSNLLAAKPKVGKSWMMMDLALAVATGGMFLGKPATQGDVIYFALEDNRRRVKSRMRKVCHYRFQAIPKNVRTATMEDKIATMDHAFIDDLRHTLTKNPNIRLVIMDTLARIRPMKKSGEGIYDYDRRSIDPFTELCAEFPKLTVVIVHHTRKSESFDPYDTASGSLGLTGATDANFILMHDQEAGCMVLHGTGRDIGEIELAVKLNTPCWDLLGTGVPGEVALRETQQKIVDALSKSLVPMKLKAIAETVESSVENTRKRLLVMIKNNVVTRIGDDYMLINKPTRH